MTKAMLKEIAKRVAKLQQGEQFIIRNLLKDVWDQIEHPTKFGIDFKKAVDEGRITNLKFVSSEKPPRHNRYERI
jgi:hypothetical protein